MCQKYEIWTFDCCFFLGRSKITSPCYWCPHFNNYFRPGSAGSAAHLWLLFLDKEGPIKGCLAIGAHTFDYLYLLGTCRRMSVRCWCPPVIVFIFFICFYCCFSLGRSRRTSLRCSSPTSPRKAEPLSLWFLLFLWDYCTSISRTSYLFVFLIEFCLCLVMITYNHVDRPSLQGVRYLAGGVKSGFTHYDPEQVNFGVGWFPSGTIGPFSNGELISCWIRNHIKALRFMNVMHGINHPNELGPPRYR